MDNTNIMDKVQTNIVTGGFDGRTGEGQCYGAVFQGLAKPLTSSEVKSECFSTERHIGQCYCTLPTLQGQFREDPVLFQHSLISSVWMNLTGLHLNPIKHLWNELERSFIQHHCLTSQMLYHMNGQKFPQKHSNILWKAWLDTWKLL